MADTVVRIKRTSVAGRAANTVTLPNAGELALNMTDQIMYSTNGSFIFEIGANLTSLNVTGGVNFGNATVNTQIGSSQVNTDIVQAGVAVYVGANVDLLPTGLLVGNSSVNTNITAGQVLVNGAILVTNNQLSANLANYIDGVTAGNGTTGGGASGNVTITVLANNGIVANSTGVFVNANSGLVANATGLYVNEAISTSINVQTTGTTAQVIDTFAIATYRTAEYLMSVKDNATTNCQSSRVIVVHDGTTAYASEHVIATNAGLGAFSTDISAGNCRLLFTPIPANTQVKGLRSLVVV